MKLRLACVVAAFLSLILSLSAQTASSPAAQAPPPLIQFSSVATDEGGNTLSGVVNITFSLYSAQQGGEPLWTETQNNVQLDSTGHYSVQLGITKPNGVPTALFTTGQARWLGVQIAQQSEQPRVLLVSAPYAFKAVDAETIGGLPPSAFVLAAPQSGATSAYVAQPATGQSVSPGTATDVTTTGDTVGYLPVFNGAATILDSVVFQSATSPFKIGINTATPATTLDVKGAGTIRGTLSLPAAGTATAAKGANSQPLNLTASAFNSTTSTAANQVFQWQAEPASNDTTTPSGTLNLLFGEGATKPSETGLNIASNGQITFASGQAFPGTGTGNGTVTSVGSGTGLTGGPITGSGTLSIATGGVTNAMLAHPSLTVTAGTDLTGGGAVALGGSTTLNLDTTKVPQLSVANFFTGSQTINSSTGNALTATASSPSSFGLVGYNNATTGNGAGVFGQSYSPQNAAGVAGYSLSTTGITYGVIGVSDSSAGMGVYGSGATGVSGQTGTATGYGVVGLNQATSGNAYAVYGQSSSTTGIGVYGLGHGSGVTGVSTSATGNGVVGINTSGGNAASFTGPVVVTGNQTVSGNLSASGAVTGASVTATGTVSGGEVMSADMVTATNGFNLGANIFGYGSYANSNAFLGFAFAPNNSGTNNTGVGYNALYSNTTGAYNTAIGSYAGTTFLNLYPITGSYNTTVGYSTTFGGPKQGTYTNATAIGSFAQVNMSNALVLGSIVNVNDCIVAFNCTSVSVGIGTTAPAATLDVRDNGNGNNTISAISASTSSSAVYGSNTASSGIAANGGYFITNSPQASGIYAVNTGSGGGDYAAYFQGNVFISGNLAKSTGTFQIDHPLDPANKYLYHSFVESPDMMNIYNGVATLDARGSVWITLPEYFEALNQDFRYQLTSMGRPQPSLYVAKEISGNRFRISGGKPGGKVSWQVTGIRHDAYADAHRIQVEVEKPPQEQGRYLHPELFGAPTEQAIGYQVPPAPPKPAIKAENAPEQSLKARPATLR